MVLPAPTPQLPGQERTQYWGTFCQRCCQDTDPHPPHPGVQGQSPRDEGLSPVPALSRSSVPQGPRPGSWAAGSHGAYWGTGQEKVQKGAEQEWEMGGSRREEASQSGCGRERKWVRLGRVQDEESRILSGQQLRHLLLGHDHVLWNQLPRRHPVVFWSPHEKGDAATHQPRGSLNPGAFPLHAPGHRPSPSPRFMELVG